MHELSIAMGIVKIAQDETLKAHAKSVLKIEIEIGALSGIALDSLNFVWPSAVKDTVLEQAKKEITIIPGKGICADCNTTYDMENVYDACPNCGGHLRGIIAGKELRVKSLEVE